MGSKKRRVPLVESESWRGADFSRTCKGRGKMRYRIWLAVMGSFLAIATVAKADQIGALLTGYEESPSVSTTASGEFTATIAPGGTVISYTETYSGLQAPVTQSHIHVGQLGVNGSIVIFLCQTAANPDPTGLAPHCPQEGTVSGTITSANVIAGATTTQQALKFELKGRGVQVMAVCPGPTATSFFEGVSTKMTHQRCEYSDRLRTLTRRRP